MPEVKYNLPLFQPPKCVHFVRFPGVSYADRVGALFLWVDLCYNEKASSELQGVHFGLIRPIGAFQTLVESTPM